MNTELINKHNIISALANNTAILPVISLALVLFKLIAPAAFKEDKNLVVKMPSLATGSYVSTDNALII